MSSIPAAEESSESPATDRFPTELRSKDEVDDAGSVRELLRVALPLVISSGSLSMMFIIDRVLLARFSIDAAAAALPAGMLHWLLISVFLGTSTYISTFVAQYEGAGRPDRVAAAMWQGIHFTLACSLLAMAVAPFAPAIFRWLGHGDALHEMEAEYFGIMCAGTLPVLLQGTLACFYSGRGKTRLVMWTNLAAMFVNGALDYWFIYGGGPIPAWGIGGAAFATVLSNVFMLGAYVTAMVFGGDAKRYGLLQAWRFDGELFGRLMKYGLPNGFHFLIDIVWFSLFIHLLSLMGKEQLAASTLAVNLNMLAFLPMQGVGTAVAILTGNRIGEKRPQLAVRSTWLAAGAAATYSLAFAALYVGAPNVLLDPYVDAADPVKVAEFNAVRPYVVSLLQFVSMYVVFDAMAIVFSSAIRGAGDTRFAVAFTFVAGFSLMVAPTWLAYRYLPEPMNAAWTSATVYIMALGVGFFLRFQQGRWKSMSVMEAA